MNPVTDPDLLAQLGQTGLKPVTDPTLLKSLEGDQRWDVIGDIKKDAARSVDALKADAANAFPDRARPPVRSFGEFIKAAPGEMVDRAGQSLSSMGSALKMPLDAMGVAFSPVTGALKGTVGSALSYVPGADKEKADAFVDQAMMALRPGRAPKAAPKIVPPTTEELFKAGDAGYKAARNLGLEIKPESASALADEIAASLTKDGHRDYLSPKVFRAIEELKSPAGQNATISDIEGVRRILGEAGKDMSERAAARVARSKLDAYLENLPATDVVAGDPAIAASTLREARGNYSAAKRSEAVGKATDTAELNTSSSHSGGNLDNATRQRLKSLLVDPRKTRGFTEAELDQLERAVRGSSFGNTSRAVGNLLGGGGGLGALASGGAGYATMGPAGVLAPVVGAGAKRLGALTTQREAAKLDELLRSRSPLAQQNATGNLPVPRDPLNPLVMAPGAGNMAVDSQTDPKSLIRLFQLLYQ